MKSKFTNWINQQKAKFVYLSIKAFIDFLICFQVIIQNKNKHKSDTKIRIMAFMVVCKRDFYVSLASILSANYFLENLDFQLIYDGKPNRWQKLLLSKLEIKLFPNNQIANTGSNLSLYPFLNKFYDHNWQGKKFLIPILSKAPKNKIIVLDSDTLFVGFPNKVAKWIEHGKGCYFLEDCGNYVLISGIEAKTMLNLKPAIRNVNTGLIMLDLENFWQKNSVPQINRYIDKIIDQLLDRCTDAHLHKDKFELAGHFLEQTLYYLTLSKTLAHKLPEKYFVFSKHLYADKILKDPIFIHYAGEPNKKSMYRYFFGSFLEKTRDTLIRKLKNSKPWYIYSSDYCYRCWHTSQNL